MDYIEKLYEKNTDENGSCFVGTVEVNSQKQFEETLIEAFNTLAEGLDIEGFDFSRFAEASLNRDMESLMEVIDDLNDFAKKAISGYSPIAALYSVIINSYLRKIKRLANKIKGDK